MGNERSEILSKLPAISPFVRWQETGLDRQGVHIRSELLQELSHASESQHRLWLLPRKVSICGSSTAGKRGKESMLTADVPEAVKFEPWKFVSLF